MRRATVLKAALGGVFLGTAEALSKSMDVSIQVSDADGLGLNGTVSVTVTASPTGNLQRVDLLIDNKVVSSSNTSPLVFQWNTTTATDGTHVLDGVAQYKSRKSTAHLAVTVNNAVTPPPPPPPPSGDFGASLHNGFEWVLQESPGPVVSVTTVSELRNALSQSGAIIDGGGKSFALGGELNLPTVSQLTTLRNATLTGGRVNKSNTSKWRLRNLDISLGTPEDNVKGSSGGFLDIDHCTIHNAPRQGVLLYPHSDFCMRNSRSFENGSTTNQDHGIYTGEGSRLLIYNCAFYNNQAYQGQFYPHYHGGLVVCCTFYGGRTRGGIVVGSEGSDPVSDLRFIGVICANNSHGWGFEAYGTLGSGISLADCLGWANSSGDFDSGSWTVTRPRHGDPKFVNPSTGDFSLGTGSAAKGIIDQSLWQYVPAADINGKARTTADAGAFAS